MKYAFEMGSGAMMYIKTDSAIRKLITGNRHADSTEIA
jgi:hypothetical protein